MIRPLRDNIVVIPLEETDKVGVLFLPENYNQNLRSHFRALVLAVGPNIREDPNSYKIGHDPEGRSRGPQIVLPWFDVPEDFGPGSIVQVSESWGDTVEFNKKKLRIGRIVYIDGIVSGQKVLDPRKYLD